MPRNRQEIDPRTREALEIDAMCVAVGECSNCPINKAMRRRAADCVQFAERYPQEAVQIARRWRGGDGDGGIDALS